jgi:hypothetical protein
MLGNILPPYHSLQELNLDWILTKVKNILRFVPDDGAVGQILRRTSYGAEWSDEQGAGGSVTSVNGQQGAVVLDAADVGALPDTTVIPDSTSDLINDSGFVDAAGAAAAAPVQSVNGMTGNVVISGGGAVDSVNGQTGVVVLDAADVGALPDSYVAPVTSVNGQTGAVSLSIPDSTSDLINDSGFVNAAGAAAAAPVQSVNGQTGAVVTTGKTTYSPTVVKTSGNSTFYSGAAVECSGAVTLSLTFTNGSDTSAGGNAFVGTLSNAPLPYSESVGIGFYGTHVFALAVRPDGSFTVRVLVGGGYWSATDRHTVSATYIAA